MPVRTERGWILRAEVRGAARRAYYDLTPPIALVRQFDGSGVNDSTLYVWIARVFDEELNGIRAPDDRPVEPKPAPIPRNSVMATLKARRKANQARERAGARPVRLPIY